MYTRSDRLGLAKVMEAYFLVLSLSLMYMSSPIVTFNFCIRTDSYIFGALELMRDRKCIESVQFTQNEPDKVTSSGLTTYVDCR